MEKEEIEPIFLQLYNMISLDNNKLKIIQSARMEDIVVDYQIAIEYHLEGDHSLKEKQGIIFGTNSKGNTNCSEHFINYISTLEYLIEVMSAINQKAQSITKFQASRYVLQNKASEYANAFLKEVAFENDRLRGEITLKILPIEFYHSFENKLTYCFTGELQAPAEFNAYNNQSGIKISLNESSKLTKSLKGHIRHELIHYILYNADLPSEDDSLMFWCFCYIYDGGAYKPLNEEEQKVYEVFVEQVEKIKLLSKDLPFRINLKEFLLESLINSNGCSNNEIIDNLLSASNQIKEDVRKMKNKWQKDTSV